MLKVMLIDDEPFILQGLQILVDWNSEGYEIAALMSNGREALDYLKENKVDLIISDIQMPVMTGLELLDAIRKDNISDARFVILTGYDDFSFMQKAIRNSCMDYILKPVQKEDLLSLLRKVSNIDRESMLEKEKLCKLEDAYLARNVIAIINGKFDDSNLEYVTNHLLLSGYIRYIDIEVMTKNPEADTDDSDYRNMQRQLLNACRETQRENSNHFIFDVSSDENNYDIGFIFCENMATRRDMTEMDFLTALLKKIEAVMIKPVRMMCGKKVANITALSKSYSSCCMLNSIKGFHSQKNIYIYEREIQVEEKGVVLCKNSLDACIRAIEGNSKEEIETSVDALYSEMSRLGANGNVVDLNINYLLFQLIHLASEQDNDVNQEEVVQYISEASFEGSVTRGGPDHMKKFAAEYSDYLIRLRKNSSFSLLSEIEKNIKEHYAENISLKSLGEQYYINSSYLGQIFKKKYDISFKDYLVDYRINEAAKMLVTTDMKINDIAEKVGYKAADYFISQFIKLKGMTPSKYRKNHLKNQ